MRVPGWCWRAYHRAHNRLLDAIARLSGACNASTWSPLRRTYAPGYSHWRCGKAHDHPGPHRFNNYIWWYNGRTEFVPLPAPRAERLEAMAREGLTHTRVTGFRHGIKPHGRERAWRRETELQAGLLRDAAEKSSGDRRLL